MSEAGAKGGGSGSVSFDRAAEFYDRTRSLPEDTMAQVVRLLGDELRDRGPTLEIGVGTGRLALPLSAAGLAIHGIDLSAAMLRRLVENAGGRVPFPVAVADATTLPFADRTFGSAYAAHVLHLIPPWEQAVGELVRVVRPGGRILVDVGGWGSGWVGDLHRRFCAEAGTPMFPGLTDPVHLEELLRANGATVRLLPPVAEQRTATIAGHLRWMDEGVFSYSWSVPEEERRRIAGLVRPWAAERFGDLDEPRLIDRDIVWRAFDLPQP